MAKVLAGEVPVPEVASNDAASAPQSAAPRERRRRRARG